jgi:lipopolysaccharide heptosyltransferase I
MTGRIRALRSRQFERILLIKPSAVGDVIHTLPILARLRQRYPAARIDWLLTPAIAELIGHHPDLSNVVLFDRHSYTRAWRSWSAASRLLELFATLRKTRYDLAIDLHGQFRSALITLASGAPVRIGFDRPRRENWTSSLRRRPPQAYRHGWTGAREGSWLVYSHRIPLPTLDVHAVDRYLWLGRLLGFDTTAPEFHVPIPASSQERINTLLAQAQLGSRLMAVLVPGTLWQTKHWHVEGFALVARYLLRTGLAVVLAGSPRERPRCQEVAVRAPGVVDLCGQTSLSELAALLRQATLCVTNDSGSMHLTVALGRPVVSVFGPTDSLWIGPYGRPHAVVQADVPCSPCYLRKLRECPNAHACMTTVSAEQVIERIEGILAGGARFQPAARYSA